MITAVGLRNRSKIAVTQMSDSWKKWAENLIRNLKASAERALASRAF